MQKKNPGDKLLVVGSVTHASRGRDILASRGIKAYVERIRPSRTHGCGYGLRVRSPIRQAEDILAEAGIKVLAVVELQV